MDLRKAEKDEIVGHLKNENVQTIVLTGAAGVGKTWIAKEISDLCVGSEGLSYMAFWVFLNDQRYESKSLLENIARQLSLLPTTEDWEDNASKEEEEPKKENLVSLQEKVRNELEAKRTKTPDQKKFLLLILDGVPDTTNEDDILRGLKDFLPLTQGTSYKVLSTRRKEPVKEASESKGMSEVTEIERKEMKEMEVIPIHPLPEGLSRLALLPEKVKKIAGFRECEEEIAKKSQGLPAAINIIAGALNRIGKLDSGILEKAATCEELLPDGVNPLLLSAYDMLPRSDRALIKCWWYSLHFFLNNGGVHYDELIVYWILEGYFGPVELAEAYKEGHRILMELIDRHMLKIQDGNNVVMEGLALTIPDCRQDGYEGTSCLGLARVFEGGDWQGFGRITLTDGMIKTPSKSNMEASKIEERWTKVSTQLIEERWKKVSTLLIDGSRLSREVPDNFFGPIQGLQVLVLFNPTFKSLPKSLSTMHELRMLVLRGCDPLENIDTIKELELLTVLEISGATSLKNIPDDNFFKKMSKLRSLNLSEAQIKLLPSSISDLIELRWLILRGCSCLETLPRLKKLTNLQMIDLSRSSKLNKFEDVTLKSLGKLRMLDISKTELGRLPILGTLENLTRLSLRCCQRLPRLSMLKALSHLQILDLTGAGILKEIPDESLHGKPDLKILYLSKTSVTNLPFNFEKLSSLEFLDLSENPYLVKIEDSTFGPLKNLRRLSLSSNIKIENLPSLSNLCKLELLNLSGCSALTKIADQSFEHMTRLQHLQLSETQIESLPSLSDHGNLRQLLLRSCIRLKQLPSPESLSKLEELDLSGAKLLEGNTADFLKNMNGLQLLNLSGTGLKLPDSLFNLTKLTQLSLGGCSLSEPEPNFAGHTKLEVLDLSETKITSLPSHGNLTSLRELKLRGCSGLMQLQDLRSLIHLEVLDLWGTGIKGFPYVISELTSLKHVGLPDMSGVEKLEWDNIKRLPEEVNWAECGILKHCKNGPCISMSATQLSGILKEHPDQLEDLEKFHISVSAPLKEEGGARDIDWHRIDPSLRNIYLQKFSVPEEGARFLEIVGFDRFPDSIEGAIVKAEYIALIRNKFMESLSNLAEGLKAVNEGVAAMKGCTLEKCTEMETIFGGEEREVKMRGNLETLRASNLPKLMSVFSIGNEKVGGFENLKELYLDCCPLLEFVFPSSQLQPENLEILEIKFCDKLKTLFHSEPLTETERKLPKLKKLRLVQLPELTSISVPENLEILEIKFCDKLKTLFDSEPPTETERKLPKLKKLHLVELPELTSIGVPESTTEIKVRECPKINKLDEIRELPHASVNSEVEDYCG
jgi:MOB kinase activator 1